MGIDDTVSESDFKTISEKRFHEMSTHQWEGVLKEMTRNMGCKITGRIGHCDHCIRGKTQKKPISKEVNDRDLDSGIRALMDVTSSKITSIGGMNVHT